MNDCRDNDFIRNWNSVESRLKALLYRQGFNRQDTEDLFQEIALKSWEGRSTVRKSIDRFIFGVAFNVIRTFIRKKINSPETLSEEALKSQFELPNHEEQYSVIYIVRHCLEKLGVSNREILKLRDFSGYTLKEIAGKLGISLSNAHFNSDKARTMFRDCVNSFKFFPDSGEDDK